jgi:redox-sensitive bicupin YhaK (pirin superfamily)
MLQLKSFDDISGFDAGWLKAKHHFTLGPYGNPANKAVGILIVLNDDEIAPHTEFGLHHHENVEIVSYLREDTVTDRDDQGNLGKTHAGDVQVMSAGTGIRHSEQKEEDVPIRLFQIWLKSSAAGFFVPLASGRNAEGALPIRTDAEVYGALLRAGAKTSYSFCEGDAGFEARG